MPDDAAPASAPSAAAPADTTPAGAADPKPPDKANESPKHKVKVDGAEQEVTLEELLKGYQTNAAGQKRLKEVAEKEKALDGERARVAGAVKAAKAGDYQALKELGLTEDEIDTLSVKVLSSRQQAMLEEERRKSLDPEKRELEDLRRDKQEREKADKDRAASDEKQQIETTTTQMRQNVVGTLELLPKDLREPFFANRVIDAWEYATEHADEIAASGVKVTPELIAQKVREEARGLFARSLKGAKDEELEGYVPADVLERLTKRKGTAPGGAPHPALDSRPVVRSTVAEEPPKKRLTEAELMRGIFAGKV